MTIKTYIYEGKEVLLTGRVAKKEMRSGKFKELKEIRPIEVDDTINMYNKWVSMEELFEVEESQ